MQISRRQFLKAVAAGAVVASMPKLDSTRTLVKESVKPAVAKTAGIDPVGNGWYRVWVTGRSDKQFVFDVDPGGIETAADEKFYGPDGQPTEQHIWGAQLEEFKEGQEGEYIASVYAKAGDSRYMGLNDTMFDLETGTIV